MMNPKFAFLLCFSVLLMAACGNKPAAPDANAAVNAAAPAAATQPAVKTKEDKVAEANAQMKAIEAEIASYRKEEKYYQNPNPEMYYDVSIYTAFYKGNEMVKLIEESGEEGYAGTVSTYFQAGKPFMEIEISSFMDDVYANNKAYLENDVFYYGIGKEKESGDESKKLDALPETEIPLEKLTKRYEGGYGTYANAMKETMKRFAAAGPRN